MAIWWVVYVGYYSCKTHPSPLRNRKRNHKPSSTPPPPLILCCWSAAANDCAAVVALCVLCVVGCCVFLWAVVLLFWFSVGWWSRGGARLVIACHYGLFNIILIMGQCIPYIYSTVRNCFFMWLSIIIHTTIPFLSFLLCWRFALMPLGFWVAYLYPLLFVWSYWAFELFALALCSVMFSLYDSSLISTMSFPPLWRFPPFSLFFPCGLLFPLLFPWFPGFGSI